MAPAAVSNMDSVPPLSGKIKSLPKPLKSSGTLAQFAWEDVTPVIGREFPTINLVNDILHAPNADDLLRDLAIEISQRGVAFFRAQDNLTDNLQKELVHRLGQMSGKPADSTLHVHPILNNTTEFGVVDAEISPVSSIQRKALNHLAPPPTKRRYDYFSQWHSDIQYEPVPADYTSLRLTQLPTTGGDTLWASGYELYDRFSTPYQKFFEGLTVTCVADGFLKYASSYPDLVKIYEEPRGSPANVGTSLSAVHPVVRTNPVTGWKSIFAFGPFSKRINELELQESDELLQKFGQMIIENHDLQVRFKWRNKNDIGEYSYKKALLLEQTLTCCSNLVSIEIPPTITAVSGMPHLRSEQTSSTLLFMANRMPMISTDRDYRDNRSAYHCATYDYDQGYGERVGNRAVGIGEKPYFDPDSTSRSEELFGTSG